MKNFTYKVEIVKPAFLENDLNKQGMHGFELFHVQAINTVIGIGLQGIPKTELTYQLIFKKEIRDETLTN